MDFSIIDFFSKYDQIRRKLLLRSEFYIGFYYRGLLRKQSMHDLL